jgi:predicted anti-sigma-YlaC factor YlaD
MDHQKLKELISSYFDGELDKAKKKLAEKHLKECSECREEFEGMNEFEEVMGKMDFSL